MTDLAVGYVLFRSLGNEAEGITIPRIVRDRLGWAKGDKLVVQAKDGALVVTPRVTHEVSTPENISA